MISISIRICSIRICYHNPKKKQIMKIFTTPEIAKTRNNMQLVVLDLTVSHNTTRYWWSVNVSEGSPSARLGLPVDITLDVWHRRTSRADLATHNPNSSTLIYPFVFSELMFGVINFTLESGFWRHKNKWVCLTRATIVFTKEFLASKI